MSRSATRRVGIEIDRGYSDSLVGEDMRFENVSRAAVIISNEDRVLPQIGFDRAVASQYPRIRAPSVTAARRLPARGDLRSDLVQLRRASCPAGPHRRIQDEAEIKALSALAAAPEVIRENAGHERMGQHQDARREG